MCNDRPRGDGGMRRPDRAGRGRQGGDVGVVPLARPAGIVEADDAPADPVDDDRDHEDRRGAEGLEPLPQRRADLARPEDEGMAQIPGHAPSSPNWRRPVKPAGKTGLSICGVTPEWPTRCGRLADGMPASTFVSKRNTRRTSRARPRLSRTSSMARVQSGAASMWAAAVTARRIAWSLRLGTRGGGRLRPGRTGPPSPPSRPPLAPDAANGAWPGPAQRALIAVRELLTPFVGVAGRRLRRADVGRQLRPATAASWIDPGSPRSMRTSGTPLATRSSTSSAGIRSAGSAPELGRGDEDRPAHLGLEDRAQDRRR